MTNQTSFTFCFTVNEEDTEAETDEEEKLSASGARPRRMSEVHTPKKSEPIPPDSSLYVFSSTNKYVALGVSWTLSFSN